MTEYEYNRQKQKLYTQVTKGEITFEKYLELLNKLYRKH